MFEQAGKKNSNVKQRQLWQQNNKPIETGFVTNPIDWKYSSARNYGNDDKTILEIDLNV